MNGGSIFKDTSNAYESLRKRHRIQKNEGRRYEDVVIEKDSQPF